MKKIILIILISVFTSCNSDEDVINPNEIINEVSISKITINGSDNFKEVFKLNSKNQIISKTINNSINDVIIYNFEYDNSGKLIKQTRVPSEIHGNEYFFNTEYDNNGLLKKHKSGTGFGYSISVDNSDINNPIIQRRGEKSQWEFNSFDEPLNDEWNEYTFREKKLIIEKSGSRIVKTVDYNNIKNPIAIMQQNTYGKRNLLFYFFDPIYPFRDKILDISSNLFSNSTEKFTSFENDGITIRERFIKMDVEIIKQEQNYATHFIVNTKDEVFDREFTTEYIIEMK